MKTNKLTKIITTSLLITGLFSTVANADVIEIRNPDELAKYQQLLNDNDTKTSTLPTAPTSTSAPTHAQGEKLTVDNTVLHVKCYDRYNGDKYVGTFDTKFSVVAYDSLTGKVVAGVPSNLTYGKYKTTDIGETTMNLIDGVYEYTYEMGVIQSGELINKRYWEQQPDGKWKYVDGLFDDGTKLYTYNHFGTVNDDGKSYYIKDGIMQTGWQYYDNDWFYFYGNGQRAENTWIGNYHVNANGVWDNK